MYSTSEILFIDIYRKRILHYDLLAWKTAHMIGRSLLFQMYLEYEFVTCD